MKKILLLLLLLSACGGKDKRYLDTTPLEQPPVLSGDKNIDTSSIPATNLRRGLGKQVQWQSDPARIILQQTGKYALQNLEQALRQVQLKIIDREADKGRYYVLYSAASFWSLHKQDALTYALTLSADATHTVISAELARDIEKTPRHDDSEALLKMLYTTLHDDLISF